MEERKEWGQSDFKLEKEPDSCSGVWYLLAVGSLVLMCVVMWWMEHTVFGGAVTCFHGGMAGAMLGLLIGTLIRKPRQPQEFSRGEKCAGWVLLAVVTVFCFWILFTRQNLWVMGVQFAAVMLWAAIETIYEKKKKLQKQKKHQVIDLVITHLVIAAATLATPVILDVSTVKQAEGMLTEAGYTMVSYEGEMGNRFLEHIFQTPVPLEENEKQQMSYIFTGRKDGSFWSVALDPWTGEALMESSMEGTGMGFLEE